MSRIVNPKLSDAIPAFLQSARTEANADLIDAWHMGMETQVNVIKGKPVEGKRNTYFDADFEWHPIRTPKNANSEPEFRDYRLSFPLEVYAEAFGSTGWDWRSRCSRWIGLDFDAILGHAQGVGITDNELERVKAVTQRIPWVQGRRSTSGKGLHLYVFFEGDIATENHTVHTALGRAVLDLMSSEVGFNLGEHVDAVGTNMWIWARKMTDENQGLVKLWSAQRALTEAELPAGWRERVKPGGRIKVDADIESLAATQKVPLEETHKRVIDALREMNGSLVWVPEHNLLQTHTCLLQRLLEEKGESLGLAGLFRTSAPGSDLATPNCFLFPLDGGGWNVYRFNPGVKEHDSWTQDGETWTHTIFNEPVDFSEAAKAMSAVEDSKGAYTVPAQVAQQITRISGYEFRDDQAAGRKITLSRHKDRQRLIARTPVRDTDPEDLDGWARNGKNWERVLGKTRIASRPVVSRETTTQLKKDVARFVISEEGKNLGWCFRAGDRFIDDSQSGVMLSLMAHGYYEEFVQRLYLSYQKQEPHVLVNLPFEPEYPGRRLWNRFAPQFARPMADKDGPHTHFDKVLEHVGKNLTPAVLLDPWCSARNIRSGPSYLLHWCASLVQRPFQLLPMLFLFGPQNSGKSSLHEMLSLLFTKGAGKVDKVFLRGNTFDGEFSGLLLAVIEEANLTGRHALPAYSKIKDITASKAISIERKGWDAFEQKNTLHLIQCANFPQHCPILDADDSRIVCIEVDAIPEEKQISKEAMLRRWSEEAPYFIRTIKTLKLPEPSEEDNRFFLTPLYTSAKGKVISAVAKVMDSPENERSAADLALRIADPICTMAADGWLIEVTASDVLDWLRWLEVKDLPSSPTVIGTALAHVDTNGLFVDAGRNNTRRWWTIATPAAISYRRWADAEWPTDHCSPEEYATDEARVSELMWQDFCTQVNRHNERRTNTSPNN